MAARRDPASQLAAAVVLNALMDLVNVGTDNESPDARELVKTEAMSFLTDRSSTWSESREMWCLAANVDPDLLRERVVAFLEGDDALAVSLPISNSTAGKRARLVGIQQARDMWEKRKADERARRRVPTKAARPTPPKQATAPLPKVSAAKQEARKVVKLRSNATRLHSTLAAMEGWKTADDLVEILGIGKGDVNQDLHRLLGHGHVEKQGQYWRRIPPETPQSPPASVLWEAIPIT